ncbi:MAG: hypothetical protein FJY85_10725 [Deltaproteobacteria bacterium]|nr:hypothetical protein [Deltaproteobacteria bacterium]
MIRYRTKASLQLQTSQGIVEVEPGRVISLADERDAIRLINERKIIPIDPVSWLIFSEILQDFLWAVPDEEARERLLAQGVKEAIYTEAEIDLLRRASKETLRQVHEAKKVFTGSRVQEMIEK